MSISSYDEALRHYNSVKPWRTLARRPYRPVTESDRGNHNQKMRMGDAGEVVFRLWSTDVITWLPSGHCVLRGYPSALTSKFMRQFGPPNVRQHVAYNVIEINGMIVAGNQSVKITNTGDIVMSSLTERFELRKLDKAKAAKLRARYRLADFSDWLLTAAALGGLKLESRHLTSGGLEKVLAHTKAGKFLEAARYLGADPSGQFGDAEDHYRAKLVAVRRYLYKTKGAVKVTKKRTLTRAEYNYWNTHNY